MGLARFDAAVFDRPKKPAIALPEPSTSVKQVCVKFRCEAAARRLLKQLTPEAAMLRGREPTAAAAENHDLVVAGMHKLIDEWLATFSPAGSALSVPHQRLIVGQMLLIQSGKQSCAGIARTKTHEAAARLAATVFVLFAQEHLQHGRDSVLGFDVDFITAFLVDIVQEASLTLEALANEVISVDQEGSASCLVGQHDFAVIFGQQGGPVSHRSRLQRILCNLSPIAEGSSVAAASADFAAAAANVPADGILESPSRLELRSRLAARYLVAAAVLSTIATCYNVLSTNGGYLADDGIELVVMTCIFMFSFSMLSGLFPTDDAMCNSGRFVLSVFSYIDCVGLAYTTWAEWRMLPPYASLLSTVVHCGTLLFLVGHVVLFCERARRGRLDWATLFTMVGCDGAVYLVAAVLLRLLGTPPPQMCYPPGSLSLPIATVRALLMIVVLPTTFSEARRLKIAKRSGLTHVRIRLEQLHGARNAAARVLSEHKGSGDSDGTSSRCSEHREGAR